MGGAIAGIFAAEYPECVKSCWLLCPAGIASAEQSAFCEKLKESRVEGNILLSHTVEDMREVFRHLFHRPPYVPEGVFRAWAKEKELRFPIQRKVMEDLTAEGEVCLMHEKLKDIRVPLCVAWGAYDEILHVSCVDVIREEVREVEPDILIVQSGHAITVEQSRVIVKHYLQFLDRVEREEREEREMSERKPYVKEEPELPDSVELVHSTSGEYLDHLEGQAEGDEEGGLRKRGGGKSKGDLKVDETEPSETESGVEAAAISTA